MPLNLQECLRVYLLIKPFEELFENVFQQNKRWIYEIPEAAAGDKFKKSLSLNNDWENYTTAKKLFLRQQKWKVMKERRKILEMGKKNE